MLNDEQSKSFSPHPMAVIATAFALGIVIPHFISIPESSLVVVGAIVATVIAVIVALRPRMRASAAGFLLVGFVIAGAAITGVEKRSVRSDRILRLIEDRFLASGDPLEVTGVLDAAPEPAPDSFYIILRVEKISVRGIERDASGVVWLVAHVRDARAREKYNELELRYGARIRVMTSLNRSETFRNPGVSSFTEFLERRGFDATGVIKSPSLVERLDDERVFVPLALVYEWRQRLLATISSSFSNETSGVLAAVMLGNRFQLSHATAERFREGGTFHVLVISGLHISFIGLIVLWVAQRLSDRKPLQFVFATIALWSYAVAVGAQPSVMRAALMFTLVLIGPLIARQANSLNVIGGAGLALLVWRPGDLFDPSFQLTFLSVIAIVTIAIPLTEKLRQVGEWVPSMESPRPPICAKWFRTAGEILFWSEREFEREMARSSHSYRIFKNRYVALLERFHLQRPIRFAVVAMIVSTSVQLFMLPLLVLYFHRLSFASILLNIWISMFMATTSLVAIAAMIIHSISGTLAFPLVMVTERLNWLMVHSVDLFSHFRIASVRLPEYSGLMSGVYGLYYVPIVILIYALAKWNPLQRDVRTKSRGQQTRLSLTAVSMLCLMGLVVFHPLSAARPTGKLRIDFLDVGQGDAALVTMPDGITLLIDGGGRPDFAAISNRDDGLVDEIFERDRRSIGESVVSEYLWWRGLDHIDYILATHADADHIDGLTEVMRNFRVRAAYVARTPIDDPEYAKFESTARKIGVPIFRILRGDTLHFGKVEADVLWPSSTNDANAPSQNNDSIVLRLRFGERVFLMTGDIEASGEDELIGSNEKLNADLVKVGHHGSQTSSTEPFVKATHPQIAVISVGLTSPYGHPNRGVVERWKANGAQVLTTGQCGTITASTNGSDLTVETFVRQR
jgi:competence protein ComEC